MFHLPKISKYSLLNTRKQRNVAVHLPLKYVCLRKDSNGILGQQGFLRLYRPTFLTLPEEVQDTLLLNPTSFLPFHSSLIFSCI